MIILSILIPTYNYANGLLRILRNLQTLQECNYEIIVGDDSTNDEIENLVKDWQRHNPNIILKYKHNIPPLGAVNNWNQLLDMASGEYVFLMHHDELPLSQDFIYQIITKLQEDKEANILLLNYFLVRQDGYNRQHIPNWFRIFIVRHMPDYLFRRNVVGATAGIVVKRSLYPRFDTNLKWLVDVGLYTQLFKICSNIKLAAEIHVGSILNRDNSITTEIKDEIPKITRKECQYLIQKLSVKNLWVKALSKQFSFTWVFLAFESGCWIFFRVLMQSYQALFNPLPKDVVKKLVEVKI